ALAAVRRRVLDERHHHEDRRAPMTTVTPAYGALLERLLDTPEARRLVDAVRSGRRVTVVSGLVGGAKALAIAALQRATGRPLFVIMSDAAALEAFRRDVEFFYCAANGVASCETEVLGLPASEADPYDGTSPHPEILEERARTLLHLARETVPIVLTTLRGALKRTIAPEAILELAVELAVDSDYRLEQVVDTLLAS